MKQKLLITLYVALLIVGMCQVVTGTINLFDVHFDHFEDGSGRITYCLPFENAGPFWGGCN